MSLVFKIVATEEWRSAEAAGAFKAGQQLVKFAHDLGLRVDVFKLETNPDEQIEKLIALGEAALNVKLPDTRGNAEAGAEPLFGMRPAGEHGADQPSVFGPILPAQRRNRSGVHSA